MRRDEAAACQDTGVVADRAQGTPLANCQLGRRLRYRALVELAQDASTGGVFQGCLALDWQGGQGGGEVGGGLIGAGVHVISPGGGGAFASRNSYRSKPLLWRESLNQAAAWQEESQPACRECGLKAYWFFRMHAGNCSLIATIFMRLTSLWPQTAFSSGPAEAATRLPGP